MSVGTLSADWTRRPQPVVVGSRLSAFVAAALVVLFVAMLDVTYRTREQSILTFDWQIGLRLGTCLICGLFGVLSLRKTLAYCWKGPTAFCTVFLLWSTATIPLAIAPHIAAVSVVCHTCVLVFVPAVLLHLGGRRFGIVVLASLLFVLLECWFFHFFVPELARDVQGRLGGPSHPNSTANKAVLAIGLLLALRQTDRRTLRVIFVPALVFCVLTLVLAQSRTAFVSTAAVVGVVLLPRPYTLYITLLLVSAAAALSMPFAFGAVQVDDVAAMVSRSDSAETVYDLQGRLELWSHVTKKLAEMPVAGTGFGCQRFATFDTTASWSRGAQPHNLVLHVLLGTGFIGFFLLMGALLSLVWLAITRPSAFPDANVAFVLVTGLTGYVILNSWPESHTLLFFAAVFWRGMGVSLEQASTLAERTP